MYVFRPFHRSFRLKFVSLQIKKFGVGCLVMGIGGQSKTLNQKL